MAGALGVTLLLALAAYAVGSAWDRWRHMN